MVPLQNPVLVREFENLARAGTWEWTRDGKLGAGSTAPHGIYLYRLSAYVYGSAPPDRDSNRSDFLHIEHARDQSGEPILEAEYWGYDEHGTPDDETDDEHLYFVRWYLLKDTRYASRGEIWLFDPELQKVGTWNLAELPCVEHNNQPDGLAATAAGTQHGVLVHVPVNMMGEMGKSLFVVLGEKMSLKVTTTRCTSAPGTLATGKGEGSNHAG